MPMTIDLEIRKNLIRKQPLFKKLTAEELDLLASLLIEKRFSKDESLVVEGGNIDSVYFIVEGNVEVRHISFKERKVNVETINKLQAGDAIGLNDSGFFSLTGKRTATVTALTPVIALRLSVAAFHQFLQTNPRVNDKVHKYVKQFLHIDF